MCHGFYHTTIYIANGGHHIQIFEPCDLFSDFFSILLDITEIYGYAVCSMSTRGSSTTTY
jgi:hypothetical protein